jgi:hypothetical protein
MVCLSNISVDPLHKGDTEDNNNNNNNLRSNKKAAFLLVLLGSNKHINKEINRCIRKTGHKSMH